MKINMEWIHRTNTLFQIVLFAFESLLTAVCTICFIGSILNVSQTLDMIVFRTSKYVLLSSILFLVLFITCRLFGSAKVSGKLAIISCVMLIAVFLEDCCLYISYV